MIRSKVDLPQPGGPKQRKQFSPAMSRLMSRTATKIIETLGDAIEVSRWPRRVAIKKLQRKEEANRQA